MQAVTVPRNDSAVWDGSRHYGASLAAFVGLAAGHGYCYCYNLVRGREAPQGGTARRMHSYLHALMMQLSG